MKSLLTTAQIAVLNKIQRSKWIRVIDNEQFASPLVIDDWDWYIIYLALMDKGIIKKNPQRPAFALFIRMLTDAKLPFILTELPSVRVLSYVQKQVIDPTFPFKVTHIAQNLLPRWQVLYRYLIRLLDTTKDV